MKIFPVQQGYNKNVICFKRKETSAQGVVSNVKDNFTYNTVDSFALEKEHVVCGKIYGQDYKLQRDIKQIPSYIKGNIGDKQVDIKTEKYSNNIFSSKYHISGFVGDKKLAMDLSLNPFGYNLNGEFAGKNTNIKIKKAFAPNSVNYYIEGDNVNMERILTQGKMTLLGSKLNPKYYGTYNFDKDFLPVLAALF